jgi:hypothetical protein
MNVVIKNNFISIKKNPISRVNLIVNDKNYNVDNGTYIDTELLQGESPLGVSMLMSLMQSSTYDKVKSVLFNGVPIKWHIKDDKVVVDKEQFNPDVYDELEDKGLLATITSFIEKHIIENEIKPSVNNRQTRRV